MRPRPPSWVPEALLLAAVVFGPLAFGAVEPWSRALLQIDLFLLLAACVLRGAPLPENPVYGTVLPAFLVLTALAAFQRLAPRSPLDPATLLPSTASARATGRELILWASYASLLWSAPQVLASRAALRRFVWTLFLLGAFVAVVGIIQRGQGNTAFYGLRPIRNSLPFGPYANRDHAASMMVMSALAGMGLLLSRWPEFRARGGERLADFLASQAAAFFLLGIVLFGIVSSLSRGAFNSLFSSLWLTAMFSTVFITGRKFRWTARGVLALGIPVYMVFLWFNPLWIGYILKNPDISVAYRLSMYRGAIILLRDFPAWGVGLGALQTAYPAYQERFVVGIVDHVHSDWLEFAVEMGLAGVAVAAAGFAAFFRAGLRAWWKNPSRTARLLAGGFGAAVLAFLIHQAAEFSFHIPANAVIFLILLCALGSATAVNAAPEPTRRAPWGTALALAAVLPAALAARPAVAWAIVWRAELAIGAERAGLLRRALLWDADPATCVLLTKEAITPPDGQPGRSTVVLRSALADASAMRPDDTLDSYLTYLKGMLLLRLGRVDDASELFRRQNLLGG